MHILATIMLWCFLVLVRLGDGIIYLGATITHAVTAIFTAFSRGITMLREKTAELVTHILHRKEKKHQNKNQLNKKLVKKRVTKSPSPLSFFVKLRYFLVGAFFSLLVIGIPLTFFTLLRSIPDPHTLTQEQVPQTTKIYDRNHILLYQIYATQNRTEVPLSQIPTNLQNATIAIEDKDFYKHPGFDLVAIVRSFLTDIKGKNLQGGSTITQQLIKSTLLTPQTSLSRKIKEVILAFWAERIYSKKQILGMYFNMAPYGGTAWGAEAAAEVYFNEHVKDLDLAQCAFLAGLPQAPSEYSPFGPTPNLWQKRQKDVLTKMLSLHYINQQQYKQALTEKLTFASPDVPLYAPHFVMYVRDLLEQKYGEALVEKGGLNVITSLDLKTQDMAQKVVSEEVANDAYLNLTNGAALVTNPANGDILAMVGSRSYSDQDSGTVNLTTSLRQPGSSIKIVTYATAMSQGMTAATTIVDEPITYTDQWGNSYSPVNYDGKFHGTVPLRTAFANSFNIPAVKTLNQIGIPTMVKYAKAMGITTWGDPSEYGLSLTLGAADVRMTDMAVVYGTVANMGSRVNLNPFLKVSDAQGNVLETKDATTTASNTVLSPGVSFILGNILADNNARQLEFGPNSPLYIPGHYVSVKTGTTDDKRDNWTFGFTNNFLVAVWVGNNDNTPMSQSLASGITGAAPIWHAIMLNLLNKQPETKPQIPQDVVTRQCGGHIEYFVRGTENFANCSFVPNTLLSPTQAENH